MAGNYVSFFFCFVILESNKLKYLSSGNKFRKKCSCYLYCRNFQQAFLFIFFADGLTALSFSISSLTVIGMLAAITYTVSYYGNVSALHIHDICTWAIPSEKMILMLKSFNSVF